MEHVPAAYWGSKLLRVRRVIPFWNVHLLTKLAKILQARRHATRFVRGEGHCVVHGINASWVRQTPILAFPQRDTARLRNAANTVNAMDLVAIAYGELREADIHDSLSSFLYRPRETILSPSSVGQQFAVTVDRDHLGSI